MESDSAEAVAPMIAPPFPSSHPGMGATPYPKGTAFRVWAPFADRVFVAGAFNQWSETRHPMAAEGNGYWSLDLPGARAGDEYKYVILSGSTKLWRTDPYAKDVTSSAGNGIIVRSDFDWGAQEYRMPAWNEIVLYEIHIGTFNDRPGGSPGNLSGAIRKLSYLKDLGINAVEIMPSYEFSGGYSWGYNPSYIFAPESDYGGPKELKRFIKAAHEHGIAVIFDVVYNHFGPGDLDLWQFDGWRENGMGGIYFYNDGRANTPWGATRPDYGRAEVRRYLRDNALFWLEEYRADGLRWDATAYIRNVRGENGPAHDIPEGWGLLQWINNEIDARQPWKISIAEDLRDNGWLTKETGAGGAGFDAQWDAGFVHPIRRALIAPDDESRDMEAVRNAILLRHNGNAFSRVIYTESHDEVANGKARVPSEIWPENPGSYFSKKRSTLGAALVFTAPGVPMIFQGQEFLEDAWFHDDDPLDWKKATRYRGILSLYRDLIRLRRNWFGQSRGLQGEHVHVYHVNQADKVVAFHRWDRGGAGDDVVVAVNMGHRPFSDYRIGFPREGVWKVRFNSDWSGYSADFGNHFSGDSVARAGGKDGLPCRGEIGIGPYSAIIFSQEG